MSTPGIATRGVAAFEHDQREQRHHQQGHCHDQVLAYEGRTMWASLETVRLADDLQSLRRAGSRAHTLRRSAIAVPGQPTIE